MWIKHCGQIAYRSSTYVAYIDPLIRRIAFGPWEDDTDTVQRRAIVDQFGRQIGYEWRECHPDAVMPKGVSIFCTTPSVYVSNGKAR